MQIRLESLPDHCAIHRRIGEETGMSSSLTRAATRIIPFRNRWAQSEGFMAWQHLVCIVWSTPHEITIMHNVRSCIMSTCTLVVVPDVLYPGRSIHRSNKSCSKRTVKVPTSIVISCSTYGYSVFLWNYASIVGANRWQWGTSGDELRAWWNLCKQQWGRNTNV